MPRIAHISDLHLQSGVPARQAQVEPILQKINEMKPDLVVISGDVTDDGWDSIEELMWAKDWLDKRIHETYWALPGNHDVGNFINQSKGQINQQRIDQWNSVFGGALEFEFDHWHLLGLNSMMFGITEPEGSFRNFQIQNSLLDAELQLKRVALFLHSPFFSDSIEEQDPAIDYWVGPKDDRQTHWNLISKIQIVELIGSGHVHQTRLTETNGIKLAWAPPASGTWVHAPGLPNPPMPEKTGFFLHHLHDDGTVGSELIECAPMLKCIEFNPWP